MEDIRDPDYAERLEFEQHDEYVRRREFLQRVALTAGLGSGLSMVLDSDTLVAEAARHQRRSYLPSPRNLPVDTFVVLMMENRSFDHYLGWMPKADGRQEGLTFVDKAGKRHQTRRFAPDFQGCAHPDPDHGWEGGRQQLNGGRCDGFLRSGDNDEFAISYYTKADVPFIPHAGEAFTTFDRFHCSLLASTFPNREYMHAGESYGLKDNSFPPQAGYNSGFPDNTIFAALKKKGIDGRYYYVDEPAAALWGPPGMQRSARVEEYYQRAAAGTLAPLSFVDPSFGNEAGPMIGGRDAIGGTSGDEHPHGDIRTGQAYMADVVHAFMESPQWKRGALFIVYDEWGGFFDHVRPPRVPDMRNNRDMQEDFGQMGFRIPAVVVSPYARRGHVDHSVYGFESILKMLCWRFGIPPLNRRVAYARNIARTFDWRSSPKLEPPNLPRPEHVVSRPCAGFSRAAGAAARPSPHDMVALRTSGYLDSIGVEYRAADASSTFREPSKVMQAFVV